MRKATKNVEFAGPSAQLAIRALSKRVDNLENGFEVPAKEIVDDKQVKFISQKIDELLKSHPEKKAQSWTDSEFASQGYGISLSEGEQKPSANEVALELLAMKAREVHYCNPGDLLEIPDVPANLIHAWVLGPPRDELRLKKDKPSKIRGEEAFKEVYLSSSVQSSALARSPALNSSGEMGSVSRPFDNVAESTPLKPFESNEAGMNVVLADDDPATDLLSQLYFDPAAEWRRIDADWLRGIEPLALDLDSDTNNTSLVLAFELGSLGKGKVLLFPGDAQVGNWLSWRDQKYEFENVEISADDLLKRTTLYKCGHHGSHNATVKRDPGDAIEHPEGAPFGLELMNDIITMIPVHRKSSDKARGWDMPYKKLYEKIREKSFNRVLRSDLSMEPLEEASLPDIVPKSEAFERIPGMPSRFEWRKSEETFEDDKSPLYFDVKIRVNKSEQEP
ncbi:MAG TPA: hypothetical protein VMM56_15755 [Planctomycetaceae bacterium]|nr:hypothetical protein [Planctomycetaceae bacterium]